jgi:hypothetical protein
MKKQIEKEPDLTGESQEQQIIQQPEEKVTKAGKTGKLKIPEPVEQSPAILIAIQQELRVPKNQFNEFAKYKFRSAEDILENVKPILRKYNSTILLSDKVYEIAGFIYIESTAKLITPTGTFECQASAGIDPGRKGFDLSQCFGTSSSYARKFCLQGLLLLDDGKDQDAINKHDVAEKRLPGVSNDQFNAIVKRFTSGEKDVFEKASKHYTFNHEQINQIKKVKNEN